MARQKPNVIKLARQRRAWAKSLSRRGMMQPNRDVIKQYALAARGLQDEEFVDRVADTIKVRNREALKIQGELEGWLPDSCNMRFSGPGPNNPFQECFTYHNSRKDCFVVVHKDLTLGIERRSTTYSSKELLLMCWGMDAIQWVFKRLI
jgi:hypothetical protein